MTAPAQEFLAPLRAAVPVLVAIGMLYQQLHGPALGVPQRTLPVLNDLLPLDSHETSAFSTALAFCKPLVAQGSRGVAEASFTPCAEQQVVVGGGPRQWTSM